MTNKNTNDSSKSTSTANLHPSYVMKKIIIDKDSIKDFYSDEAQRRLIRLGKVKSILSGLDKGIHFNSPFVVNRIDNKYKIIDANHRYEALKLKIAKDNNFSITIWVAIYDNLSKPKEKEIFRLWNIGVTQTATDFLKLYYDTIPLGKSLLRELPISIYGSETLIPMKHFIGAHILAKKQNAFNGGYAAGKEQTIADFVELNIKDLEIIKEFSNLMRDSFGSYHKKNNKIFYGTTAIPVLYRIWFDNQHINYNDWVILFKKIVAQNIGSLKEMLNGGGRMPQTLAYNTLISTFKMKCKYNIYRYDEIPDEKKKMAKILEIFNNK